MKENSIFLSSCFRREGIKLVKKERDGNVNVSIDQRGRLLIGHIPWPRSCASRLALIHAQIEFHDSDSRARSIIAHGRRDRYIGARFHGDISRSPLSATGLMNFLAGYRGPLFFSTAISTVLLDLIYRRRKCRSETGLEMPPLSIIRGFLYRNRFVSDNNGIWS